MSETPVFACDLEEPLIRVVTLADFEFAIYDLYLQTDHWRLTKAAKDLETGLIVRCQNCNAPGPLDMHHRCYRHKGHERTSCILRLCRGCHKNFHKGTMGISKR